MKIPLLIFAGWGHAASTPFYYTLSVDNKYCHGGHRKETGYLNELDFENNRRLRKIKHYI